MSIEEKKKAIIDAIEAKKVSGIQLEPSRKGASISKIRKGGHVAESTIERIYNTLLAILPETKQESIINNEISITNKTSELEQESKQEKEEKEQGLKEQLRLEIEENKRLSIELEETKKALQALEKQLESVNERLAGITEYNKAGITEYNKAGITEYNKAGITEYNKAGITEYNKASSGEYQDKERIEIFGLDWIIRLEAQGVKVPLANGTEKTVIYQKYFAKKKIAGKLHRIYLGEKASKEMTESKVKAYCEKHSLLSVL